MDAAEGYDYTAQFLKMILSLGALFALLFVGMWLMRRFYRGRQAWGNNHSSIKIIERRPLTPKASLYVVEVEGRSLLIGLSPQGVHRVAELGDAGEPWVDPMSNSQL
jgi:flagellar protein FliO/FliZ